MKHIPELTGLRGLAALLVFISHSFSNQIIPGFSFESYGTQGVLLFFTLSGYLMAGIYLNQPLNTVNITTYCKARIGRVVPLYLLILIISFFISNYVFADFRYDFRNPAKFLSAILFVKTPYELWTIPVEVHFYLIFILFWFFYKKESSNKYFLIAFPFIVFLPSIIIFIIKHKFFSIMPTFSIFFFGGVFISILKRQKRIFEIVNKVPVSFVWLIFILYLINLNGMRSILGITDTKVWHNLYSFLLLFLFFSLVVIKTNALSLLKFKPIVFLGEISFGFYLIHRPIIDIISSHYSNHIAIIAISLVVSLILAFVLFKVVETPARSLITKKTN